MICSPETQQKMVSDAVGIRTTQPVVGVWNDHIYSCRYVYGGSVMVLSVKELAGQVETDDYFAALQRERGIVRRTPVGTLGQGGFVTRDGSVVARKDYKVLLVDITGLPTRFGSPPDSRENIALNAAVAIMGCWTGA